MGVRPAGDKADSAITAPVADASRGTAVALGQFLATVQDLNPAEQTQGFMLERGVLPGLPLGRFFPELADALLISVTELNHPRAIERFLEALP